MEKTGLSYTTTIRTACLGILQNGHRGEWKEYSKYIEFECDHCKCSCMIKLMGKEHILIGDAHTTICSKEK